MTQFSGLLTIFFYGLPGILSNSSIIGDSGDINIFGKVTNITDRLKARDTDAVKDVICALADAWAGNAWIYQAEYTKRNMTVTLRAGLTGFDISIPVILSGEGGIYNSVITFDTSIA
ncbi:MAG: hypothetical protein MUD09_05820, partial [Desulfobacterales bacterium]|nr:hypothetical protein [Desulfobacterales bacterium]